MQVDADLQYAIIDYLAHLLTEDYSAIPNDLIVSIVSDCPGSFGTIIRNARTFGMIVRNEMIFRMIIRNGGAFGMIIRDEKSFETFSQ